jgi:hypothetical protein
VLENVVARDGIAQHCDLPEISLQGIVLNPAA